VDRVGTAQQGDEARGAEDEGVETRDAGRAWRPRRVGLEAPEQLVGVEAVGADAQARARVTAGGATAPVGATATRHPVPPMSMPQIPVMPGRSAAGMDSPG
jgi:hypothetical protein